MMLTDHRYDVAPQNGDRNNLECEDWKADNVVNSLNCDPVPTESTSLRL
jgi:hypothetical protein